MSFLHRYFKPKNLIQLYSSPLRQILHTQKTVVNVNQLLTAVFPIIDSGEHQAYFTAFNMLDAPDFTERYLGIKFDFAELIEENKYPEEETIVVNESQKIKYIITDIYNDNSKLLQIEPRQFEELVAELLYSQGYIVELTKQTRDNGYDILAIRKIANASPLKFLVECKRYIGLKVGVEIIRSFKNVIDENHANRGIIATTSYFTRDAVKKRDLYPYLLDFRDKDDILEWIKKYYVEKYT